MHPHLLVLPRRRRILTWLLLPAAPGLAASAPLVMARPGTLPLLITVPHGGNESIPETPVRRTGVITRDVGTLELAVAVCDLLEARLGARPYLVAARFSRRFADANRSIDEAIESPSARPPYEAYHEYISKYVSELRQRFPGEGLLIDLHGQSADPGVVHRGTQNGATVTALLRRRGTAALVGPHSVMGALQAAGYRVHPPGGAELRAPKEDTRWAGGHTVRTYGSEHADGIDALQIEVGSDLRADARFAGALADALATFHRAHQTPAAAPVQPRHLVLAQELVSRVQAADNAYVPGGSLVRFPGDEPGARHAVKADCSGFLLALFARAGYGTRSQMVFLNDGPGRKRPRAEDFLASIEQEKGFRRLRRVSDLRAGDLLAHAMLDAADKEAAGTTGHVFLLANRPRPIDARPPIVAGTRQYLVTVIDSNREPVGDDDTRLAPGGPGEGLGTGTIRLYADADGALVGWARTFAQARRFFSYDPRFPSDAKRRRAELGRVAASEQR